MPVRVKVSGSGRSSSVVSSWGGTAVSVAAGSVLPLWFLYSTRGCFCFL